MDSSELENHLEFHDLRVRAHGTEYAEGKLRESLPEVADEVLAEYRRRIGDLVKVTGGLVEPGRTSWYSPKELSRSPRWAHARKHLGLPEDAVEHVSEAADEILAGLDNPVGEDIAARGLVLGHVQSGKTTNFLSVAAKAADNGYDLIIILAGVHNSLRRQTQDRAARTLVHNPSLWWLGTKVGDFTPDGNPLQSHLSGNGKRGLLVVKKHATILGKLADWLEDESDAFLRQHAVLVIDDEADQAGLDVSASGEREGVHRQLHRIVNLQTSDGKRRCSYLAYTATPYANILTSQDESGLYPRSFIYPLDKPAAHVGPAELFGDAVVGRPIRLDRDGDASTLTDGMRDAITWFVLATAARVALGSRIGSFHSSMLVHTTNRTDEQRALKPEIEAFLASLRDRVQRDPDHLRETYDQTLAQVPSDAAAGDDVLDEPTADWGAVRDHVSDVLERLIERTASGDPFVEDGHEQVARSGVIVDNSSVEWRERLTYSNLDAGEPGVIVIVIGGNTLSRGLTLEGLVSSYFVRTARTYDTLMQMGRWFGYRPGYRHLVRIWTTPTLLEWFRELTEVEEELRGELEWMVTRGLSPADYGPRIRVSPHLNITRASVMKSVTTHLSYADSQIDPAWVDIDPGAIAENQRLARELASGLEGHRVGAEATVFEGVPSANVRRFIDNFRFHEHERRVDSESLIRYLDEEERNLRSWNVIFKSAERGKGERFDFGGSVGEVTTVIRARSATEPVAHIQSVVDSQDHRLDLGPLPPESTARFRDRHEPPLLVVYAIDRVSPPKGSRVALDAPATPISVGIILPASDSSVEYVSPAIRTDRASIEHKDAND